MLQIQVIPTISQLFWSRHFRTGDGVFFCRHSRAGGKPLYKLLFFFTLAPQLSLAANKNIDDMLGVSNLLQMSFMLLGILLLIFFGAKFLVKLKGFKNNLGQSIRIVSSLSLSVKEKIILVEVAEKQILIAVSSAGIRALHVFDAPAIEDGGDEAGFSKQLHDILSQEEIT